MPKNLQGKYINNMRFSTAYMKKTTKVSNTGDYPVDTKEPDIMMPLNQMMIQK